MSRQQPSNQWRRSVFISGPAQRPWSTRYRYARARANARDYISYYSSSVASKPSAGAQDSVGRCPTTCAVCGQKVVDGKAKALFCEGLCKLGLDSQILCRSIWCTLSLSTSPDPFLCAGCFQKSCKEELVDLRNTVSILREEIAQLRKALDEKHVNDAMSFNCDKHCVRS